MSVLVMRLAAPLQSWGAPCSYSIRETEYQPTRSGIIGMIAAAMGYPRQANLDNLRKLKIGVRVDRQGALITDFQTIQDPKRFARPMSSEVTKREYLSDAVFVAGIECKDEQFMENIVAALKAPIFPLYLGRRSCPPTLPLMIGLEKDKTLIETLRTFPLQAVPSKNIHYIFIYIDSDSEKDSRFVRDDPISFDQRNRMYTWRYMQQIRVAVDEFKKIGLTVNNETDHDAFNALI